jgi:hypothetical protein
MTSCLKTPEQHFVPLSQGYQLGPSPLTESLGLGVRRPRRMHVLPSFVDHHAVGEAHDRHLTLC